METNLFKLEFYVTKEATDKSMVAFSLLGNPFVVSMESKGTLREMFNAILTAMENADLTMAEYRQVMIKDRGHVDDFNAKETEELNNEWMKEFNRVYKFMS